MVGASLAGAKAEALRELGFDGSVVLVGAETERPYSRPPLFKDYLSGKVEFEEVYVHAEDFMRATTTTVIAQDENDVAARRRGVRTWCETTLEKHPIPEVRVSEDHTSDAGTARSFDPERGAFDPPRHAPSRNPESNPRGVRHIDETGQDHMAVGDRPRAQAAQDRRSRMVVAAARRLKKATGRMKAPSHSTLG